jgi:hypothetical protein
MYDAILFEEGQDFEAEWFQLVSEMLIPKTISLLLVEDLTFLCSEYGTELTRAFRGLLKHRSNCHFFLGLLSSSFSYKNESDKS